MLRKVEAGETVVITRRGKPVADLVPHTSRERRWLSPADVMEIRASAATDPGWGAFLRQLDEEDELEPIP